MPDLPETPVAADPRAPADEVDPELERLTPARRRRSPVAATAVIVIGGVLLAHLAADLRYSLTTRLPVEIAASAVARDGFAAVPEGTLVAVSGQPDYRNALLFEPKGDKYRRAFFRILGSGGRLWVRAEQTSTRHEVGERFVGRLLRFDALPYAAQVRAYYAALKVTRQLDVSLFRRRIQGELGADFLGALTDRAGEPVVVSDPARTTATVIVNFPDELQLTLSKERFAVEEDARREVERLGVPVSDAREDEAGYDYVVRFQPQQRDALIAACDKQDFAVALRRAEYGVPLSSLGQVFPGANGLPIRVDPAAPPFYDLDAASKGKRLVAQGASAGAGPEGMAAVGVFRIVPWEQVESIQLAAPVSIPPAAFVVVEADLPSAYGWAKALAVLLLLFVGLNVWLLTRSLRGR